MYALWCLYKCRPIFIHKVPSERRGNFICIDIFIKIYYNVFKEKTGRRWQIVISFLLEKGMNNIKLEFYGLLDFFPNRESIKQEYDNLSLDDKYIYKMYVYSLPFEDDKTKDLIWEYLNGWEECIFDLSKRYREKKTKCDKRRIYEMQNYDEVAQLERYY